MNYRVGQILFLIADASKVVPIQVIEEVIRTTLKGKEKTYIVKFPDKKETTADIKKIKGQLFNSREEVKNFMFNNAKSAIEQIEASRLALSEEDEKVQPSEDDGIIRVDLGNGKFGKIDSKILDNTEAQQ